RPDRPQNATGLRDRGFRRWGRSGDLAGLTLARCRVEQSPRSPYCPSRLLLTGFRGGLALVFVPVCSGLHNQRVGLFEVKFDAPFIGSLEKLDQFVAGKAGKIVK